MPIAPEVLNLIGYQKAEFNITAKLRSRVLKLQSAVALIAAGSIFVEAPVALYFSAIVATLLAVLAFFFALELSRSRAHAERLRRTTMVVGGLGLQLAGAELFELCSESKAEPDEAKRLIDPKYFASLKPPSTDRMVDMLEESAMWTTNLAKVAANETWFLLSGIVGCMVVTLLSASAFTSTSEWQVGARVLMAVLTSLLTVDFLGSALSYAAAHRGAQRVVDRLQPHKSGGATMGQVMLIFGDYNSIVESMPPFPSGLYARHQKKLNEQFKMFLTGPQ